ncbi:MAG: hypothetical protein JO330_05710 [Mycobacteriaceae bacterium]|nr:hypothetical protein [Mycobacteriaceae bacterium]
MGQAFFAEPRDDALTVEFFGQEAAMTHDRDDRRAHRRLMGHIIATILLAVLAAVAVWIFLVL